MTEKKKILFICNHNAGRSQMAEGILNSISDEYEGFSAGVNPSDKMNENIIKVMNEIDIDLSEKMPKPISTFNGVKFDIIVVMCKCPDKVLTLESPVLIRKVFSDPYKFKGQDDEVIEKFRELRDEIADWIKRLIVTKPDELGDI